LYINSGNLLARNDQYLGNKVEAYEVLMPTPFVFFVPPWLRVRLYYRHYSTSYFSRTFLGEPRNNVRGRGRVESAATALTHLAPPWKAKTAIPRPGVQELGAYASILAHAYGYGLYICPYLLAELGYLVYIGDLYRQEGIGRVLDLFVPMGTVLLSTNTQ
jgi:hypothetical protein